MTLTKCNQCGAEKPTNAFYGVVCYDCFPMLRCNVCGYETSHIGMGGHYRADAMTTEYCPNTVIGGGDTKFPLSWSVVTNKNADELGKHIKVPASEARTRCDRKHCGLCAYFQACVADLAIPDTHFYDCNGDPVVQDVEAEARRIVEVARQRLYKPQGAWTTELDKANAKIKVEAFDQLQILFYAKKPEDTEAKAYEEKLRMLYRNRCQEKRASEITKINQQIKDLHNAELERQAAKRKAAGTLPSNHVASKDENASFKYGDATAEGSV